MLLRRPMPRQAEPARRWPAGQPAAEARPARFGSDQSTGPTAPAFAIDRDGDTLAPHPARRRSHMDKVVHFEIPVDDRERAKSFYTSVFEWNMMDSDMGGGQMYTIAQTTNLDENQRPTDVGAINGGLADRTGPTSAPVVTVQVDSIDDTLKKVEASGGETIQPRTSIPNMGAFGYFKDSEGNVMGLWETMG
jgi:predicted enzyme related to lactoylglutathione lyase